ncbi:MAG TPA: helix-turn-helix transcriptional regulator [Chloroflexia bacterium]|nr:helix-turn-helix transcriptional regulator [Chloroflexia bacterium]
MKRYRRLLRLSQQDLSKLSGLNRSYLGSVERGERNIGIDNLEEVAKALGIEAWQLLREE